MRVRASVRESVRALLMVWVGLKTVSGLGIGMGKYRISNTNCVQNAVSYEHTSNTCTRDVDMNAHPHKVCARVGHRARAFARACVRAFARSLGVGVGAVGAGGARRLRGGTCGVCV